MYASPPPVSRTFSSPHTEAPPPLNTSHPPQPLGLSGSHAVSAHLPVPGASHKWGCAMFVLSGLASFSAPSSRFVHAAARVRISFLSKVGWYSILGVHRILFTQSRDASRLWLLFIVLLRTRVCRYPFGSRLSVLLGMNPGVDLLVVSYHSEQPPGCLPRRPSPRALALAVCEGGRGLMHLH